MVKVKQNEAEPVEHEILAKSIVSISEALRKLKKSGLNRRAIIVLIAHDTKLGQRQIDDVLSSLESLESMYTYKD